MAQKNNRHFSVSRFCQRHAWLLVLAATALTFWASQNAFGQEIRGKTREEILKEETAAKAKKDKLKEADDERIKDMWDNVQRKKADKKEKEETIKRIEQVALDYEKQADATTPQMAMGKRAADLGVLLFTPSDCVVEQGASFSTDLSVHCRAQQNFTDVDLIMAYDPVFIAPISVHDDALRPLLAGEPDFAVDSQMGRITYKARLAEPKAFFTQRVLTVVWQARRTTDLTRVNLRIPEWRSSIRMGASDILSDELMSEGALIPLGVTIIPEKANVNQGYLPAGEAGAFAVPTFTKGPIWLELTGPIEPVDAGEEFDVGIYLFNPDKTQFDLLSLLIRYPTDRIEILDWDMGNWIRMGINIHDAPAHEDFPFDFHQANEVNPVTGEIFYRMGASHSQPKSAGLVAEIRARALRPASVEDFHLISTKPGAERTTEISFLQCQLLVAAPEREPMYFVLEGADIPEIDSP